MTVRCQLVVKAAMFCCALKGGRWLARAKDRVCVRQYGKLKLGIV